MARILWLLIVQASLSVDTCGAANHYCIQDSTKAFSMNVDSDQPETLLTNHRDLDGLTSSQRCSWEVRLGRMTEPLQLVLKFRLGGWRGQAAVSGAGCPSELTVALQDSIWLKKWKNAMSLPKAPLIVSVVNSSQLLTVRFLTGASRLNASCGRIELSISVARKGFCGRNMLLHRGRCVLVSEEKLQLSDLEGTGAELAAISGWEQLQELLRDNERRAEDYPFRKPLNLIDAPIRVGIFCNLTTGRAVFINTTNGSCLPQQFDTVGLDILSSDLSANVNCRSKKFCTSLRPQTKGSGLLESCDCSSSVRSLLSFSEIPDNSRTAHSCDIRSYLENLSEDQHWLPKIMRKKSKPVISHSGIADLLLIVVAVAIFVLKLLMKYYLECSKMPIPIKIRIIKLLQKSKSQFRGQSVQSKTALQQNGAPELIATGPSHSLQIQLEQMFHPYSPISEV